MQVTADPRLALRIKRARERLGWTQQELAERIGRDRKTVDNWENSRTTPRSSIGALEAVLGISLGEDGGEPDPREEELRRMFPDERADALIETYRRLQRRGPSPASATG